MDLNEITMNLVPFPRMHYLLTSQTPLYALSDIKIPARRYTQDFVVLVCDKALYVCVKIISVELPLYIFVSDFFVII